jgi:aldose 1-epimerase
VRETLLGCASPEQYVTRPPIWAPVGRYANRIAKSRFELDGVRHLLPSQGENQLHGGPEGFDKRRWQIVRKTTAKCCSRWIRLMAIRASRQPYRHRALYADRR